MRDRRRTASRVIRVEVGPRNTSWLHGTGVAAACDELGIPRMKDPIRKQLCCPTNRLDDLLALLEHRDGRVIELTAADR